MSATIDDWRQRTTPGGVDEAKYGQAPTLTVMNDEQCTKTREENGEVSEVEEVLLCRLRESECQDKQKESDIRHEGNAVG